MQVEFGGDTLLLCAERAIFWPRRRTLLIADTHFGKAGVFRRAGIAIPEGIDASDLLRLTRLIAHYAARRLVILGDFFHGDPGASAGFIALFDDWLERHLGLEVEVVRGNHDRHGGAGRWPGHIRWYSDDLSDPPYIFTHAPVTRPSGYVLCGHLHPVLRLASDSGDHARLPAFWFTPTCAVLPAFGTFTGGTVVRPGEKDQVFVIAERDVIAMPTAGAAWR